MPELLIAVGLIALIVAHELGHFLAAKAYRLFVHEFGIGFPPRITAWKRGETEYSLNWLPLGGFVRIAGEEDDHEGNVPKHRLLSSQSPWKRASVIAAGVAVNAILAWVMLTGIFMVGTPKVVVITGVEPNSPAATAGLQEHDIVVGYSSSAQFADAARFAAGNTFLFDVQRDGQVVRVSATPRTASVEHPGSLGVSLIEGGIDRAPFYKAPWEALKATYTLVQATIMGFVDLVVRLVTGSVPSDVVGPVGIVAAAGQVSSVGWVYLLQMLAIISINLAVLNLLPVPALDGGKLYLTLIEGFTGWKMPKWLETRINAITFILLIGLMLILTARDVLRLF